MDELLAQCADYLELLLTTHGDGIIGWKGHEGQPSDEFACEHCKAPSCIYSALIVHAESCPVRIGRLLLEKIRPGSCDGLNVYIADCKADQAKRSADGSK